VWTPEPGRRTPHNNYRRSGRYHFTETAGLGCACIFALAIAAPLIHGASPAPPADFARLRIDGRHLQRGDAPFVWRGFTAFSLAKHVAHGREADAVQTLDWAAASGFNVARVLAMIDWEPQWLTPDAGARALPRLLGLAAERGIVIQIVVFAGTRRLMDGADDGAWRAHAAAIGAVCRAAANCVVELANENYHHTQDPRLTDVTFLQSLRAQIDPSIPVSCGAGPDDTRDNYQGCGDYITVHLGRGGAVWDMVARKREMERVSAASGKFVVDNEPIGAGEEPEPGRRLADAAPFFALAALGRVLGIGSTFHFEDGLASRPPRGAQQTAAAAFIAGSRIVADDAALSLAGDSSIDRPLRADTDRRVFTAIAGDHAIVLVLPGSNAAALERHSGWEPSSVATNDRAGDVRVLEFRRRTR
jgi:hypothetical protein